MPRLTAGSWWGLVFAVVFAATIPGGADAQQLRFTNHRELAIPDYATFKLGPFYSTVAFSQSVAYRYTRSRGTGTDYLVDNQRGVIVRDGHELPCVSVLEMRNYLLLTENTDLDASIRLVYEYYPLATQENEFYVDMGQEGIVGTLSSEVYLSPYLRGTLSDSIVYRTDYVDTRGIPDRYGGQRYEHLWNAVGLDMDWLLAKDKNVGLSLSRADNIPFGDTFLDQESVTYGESLLYEQIVAPGVAAGARANFRQVRYRDPDETSLNLWDYGIYLSLERGARARLTKRSSITFGAGYGAGRSWTSTQTNGVTSETLVGGVELTTELSERLTHVLSYGRAMAPGFLVGSLEIADRYGYRIDWKGDRLTLRLFSAFSTVKPADDLVEYGEYWDWSSGLSASLVVTRYVVLEGSSAYTMRDNRYDAAGLDVDSELVSDYRTWVNRLGTTVNLTSDLFFDTYAQNVERFSDDEDLAYERFTFYAGLRYRHEF